MNTIGQVFAGQTSTGGVFNLQIGFWNYLLSAAPTANGILSFTNTSYSVNENGGTATITVTRAGGSDGAVSLNHATANGTATAGSDYTAATGALSWNAGEAGSKTFTVPILDDSVFEGNETVNLTLSSPTGGATLGSPNAATLTIVDNDVSCSYSIAPTSQNIAAAGGGNSANVTTANGCAWTAASNAAWLTITSGSPGNGSGTVTYSAAANTGAARTGTLTIAGQTLTVNQAGNSTATVNVSIPTTLTASNNTILTAPLNISDTTGSGVTSFDFRLTYDPAIFTPTAAPVEITGTLSSAFEINVSSPSAGTLLVSGFGTAPLSGAGVLLNFKFNAVGAASACSALSLTNFGFNEGNPANNRVNGRIPVSSRASSTQFDFDGDGRADISVFRPAEGIRYLNRSTGGFRALPFGIASDKLVPADYDGDSKTDIAVFRNGTWYLQRSTAGFTGVAFGANTDLPVPNAFVP